MYNRSYGQRRPPRIPQNYAGNAFGTQESAQPPRSDADEDGCEGVREGQAEPARENSVPPEACRKNEKAEDREPCGCRTEPESHAPVPKGKADDELLLLALILLLTQGGGERDAGEAVPLLVLLLFC